MPELPTNVVDRYALGHAIAAGGMATLHLGRLVGSAGFSRTVAVKKLHGHLCVDPAFVSAFADEARLAARIHHPNVVPTLDVVSTGPSESAPAQLLLVMEYIDGESLSQLRKAEPKIPLRIVVAILSEMLHGLHSAHEAKSEAGERLEIVHRDVSPQNVLVGADGVARLVDFGIARATGRVGNTNDGEVKGKLAYMAPEQIRRERITRKADIFSAGVVLWELLTGQRLFASDNPGATLEKILVGWVPPPSSIARDLPPALDEITMRALDADPDNRFETAREMAIALEDASPRALGREVAQWVESMAGEALAKRRALVAAAERTPTAVLTEVTPVSIDLTQLSVTPSDQVHTREIPIEIEPTVLAFSSANESYPPVAAPIPSSRPPARSPGTSKAIAVVALAASLTVFIGTRHTRATVKTAAAEPQPVAAAVVIAPVATAPALTLTPLVTSPSNSPSPSPPSAAMGAAAVPSHVAVASNATVLSVSAPARRIARPRPAPSTPAHASCVAKLDPATGKTVYKGDCD